MITLNCLSCIIDFIWDSETLAILQWYILLCFSTLKQSPLFDAFLMGEGFILLTRGYGFMGGVYHPPFDTLKIGTSTDDIKLKLYR